MIITTLHQCGTAVGDGSLIGRRYPPAAIRSFRCHQFNLGYTSCDFNPTPSNFGRQHINCCINPLGFKNILKCRIVQKTCDDTLQTSKIVSHKQFDEFIPALQAHSLMIYTTVICVPERYIYYRSIANYLRITCGEACADR